MTPIGRRSRHGIRPVLAALFVAAFALPSAVPGTAKELPSSARPLVVACDNNYPPYAFLDAGGQLRGIVPDQWAAWSKATGIPVLVRGYLWAEAIRVFERGEADVLDTVFETQERRLKYDFTPAYATIEVPVFIHKSISGIGSASDLKGFRVAVKEGDASIGALAALGVDSIDSYPDYESIVRAAARLETRIFCVDKPPALYYLYKLGADKDFRVAFNLSGGAFHRAVPKGSTELLALVERGFGEVPKQAYEAIDRAWLGAPIAARVDLRLFAAILGFVSLLLVLTAAIAWVLRLRVSRATSELREKVDALEESESRNRAFIAALPDLFFVLDREGRYLSFYASDVSRLAAPPEVFLGRKMDELGFPENVVTTFLERLRDTVERKATNIFEYALPIGGEVLSFEGRIVPFGEDRALLVTRDMTEKHRQEEKLQRSLVEKEILLKEIHHRVKNNMQVISSLIALQTESFHDLDDRRLLAETQQRIRSMARLHELLYDSPDLASIGALEYLETLAWELSTGYGAPAIAVTGPRDLRLSLDEAVPFGLIANELTTNALKYAYPDGTHGPIRISLGQSEGLVGLAVEDEGRGLGPGVSPETCKSMGFLLVRSLAAQLGGTLSFSEAPGLRVELRFPRP